MLKDRRSSNLRHNRGGFMAEKDYVVTITEILKRKVPVKANNIMDAQYKVECDYRAEKHVLDADDYVETLFKAEVA